MTEAVFLSTNREHRAGCRKQFAIDTEPVPVQEPHTSKGKGVDCHSGSIFRSSKLYLKNMKLFLLMLGEPK